MDEETQKIEDEGKIQDKTNKDAKIPEKEDSQALEQKSKGGFGKVSEEKLIKRTASLYLSQISQPALARNRSQPKDIQLFNAALKGLTEVRKQLVNSENENFALLLEKGKEHIKTLYEQIDLEIPSGTLEKIESFKLK